MSAGHHIKHSHTAAQIAELKKLLAEPRVKKLLASGARVDFSHEMPLTGGSTQAWGTFFLDPSLKKTYQVGAKSDVDLAPFVLRHEEVEKALRMELGFSYDRAHLFATVAERLEVEAAGLKWPAYRTVMASIVRQNEHEHPKTMPKGFDYGPVRESRNIKSTRWLANRAA